MFSLKLKKNSNYLYNITNKNFAFGKWNLYRFRRDTSSYDLKDFTKNVTSKEWINTKIQEEKNKLKTQKLSVLLKTDDRNKLSKLNPIISPNKRQLNKYLRKETIKKIQMNEEKDYEDLTRSLFQEDYTAQVLENIRKTRENKIFNRKMHQITEQKLALKIESRKAENLIENYNQKFLNYQNFNSSIAPYTYNLLNFVPNGRMLIGKKLGEINEANPTLVGIGSNSNVNNEINYLVDNKYMDYENNKKQLANMRIGSILNGKKSNPDLQKYLKHSADEVETIASSNSNSIISIIKTPDNNAPTSSIVSTLNKSTSEIAKENIKITQSIENFFSPHFELTSKIQQYEIEVYNEFKNIDIYNKYNVGITKFGNLTLEENLNYIKFNIKNSKELFKMFTEIIHPDFTKHNKDNNKIKGTILSAILQKFAIGYKKEEDLLILFSTYEYKELLKNIKNDISKLSDKNLVDNIWSIARLHKWNRNFSPIFFQHLLDELITEISEYRMKFLNFQHISYLCESFNYLNIDFRKDDSVLVRKEQELENKIYEKILYIFDKNNSSNYKKELEFNFHPYNLTKILNFFYKINLDCAKYNLLLQKTGQKLLQYIEDNKSVLIDSLNVSDFVKLVKVYSWGISRIGNNNTYIQTDTMGDEEGKANLMKIENLPVMNKDSTQLQLFKNIIESMDEIVLLKYNQLDISQCTSLVYDYSNANIYNDNMLNYLHVQITNKLERSEDFKLKDVLYYTYGISKFYTRKVFPEFSNDLLCIIYPNLNEKTTNLKYKVLNRFKNKLFEKNDTLNVSNLSIICYSSLLMGYSDIDFYLPIFHNIIMVDKDSNYFKNRISPIKLEDLGYLIQSLSLLNYNEMNLLDHLCDKFSKLLLNETSFNLFSVSQVFSAIVNLSLRRYLISNKIWNQMMNHMKKYFNDNINEAGHAISTLWIYSYFENMDKFLFDKFCEVINDSIKIKPLRKYEKIVLNQVIVFNFLINDYLYDRFTKDFIEDLNNSSLNFEKERKSVQNKISEDKFQSLSPEKRILDILKKNSKDLDNNGLNFVENHIVGNSYIAPVFFPNRNLCLLFYDHSEKMKDKNINGYNSIKEDIFYSLGYKIERIYANECDNIIEDDDKMFNLLMKKIN